MENPSQPASRPSGLAKSCTECQRRKQKCNKEWPCNHCRTRKVPQLCHFGQKKRSRTPEEPAAQDFVEDDDIGIPSEGWRPSDPYGTHARVETFQALEDEDRAMLIQIIPPRAWSDLLVQEYFRAVHCHYAFLHTQTFLEQYASWWYGWDHGSQLSAVLTCLLLRVWACAVMYCQYNTIKQIVVHLKTSAEDLAKKYHRVAQRLSSTITLGNGGVMQIQQLLHAVAYFKCSALHVEGWHILTSAIHTAQELDMHKLAPPNKFSQFEDEMRTRIWCILYTWDWQMANGLKRPMVVDHNTFTARNPRLILDEPTEDLGLPSPFMAHILLGDLVRKFVGKYKKTDDTMPLESALDYIKDVDDWFDTFPPVYRWVNADNAWDESHPWVKATRCHLQLNGGLLKMFPLKLYLSKPMTAQSSSQELTLRKIGVDCCLNLIEIGLAHVDTLPVLQKHHMVTFGIFDASAFLCAAMLNDQTGALPKINEVTEAIKKSVMVMDELRKTSALGSLPFRILSQLAESLSLYSRAGVTEDDSRPLKRTKAVAEQGGSNTVRIEERPIVQEPAAVVTESLLPASSDAQVLEGLGADTSLEQFWHSMFTQDFDFGDILAAEQDWFRDQ